MGRSSESMKAAWQDPAQREKMLNNRPYVEKRKRMEDTGLAPCISCGTEKPLSEFPAGRKSRSGQARYAWCKKCHSEYQRTKRLKKWFDLTPEEYDRIFLHQGGVCAICKQPPKPEKRLSVDHDHKSGLVRGLLCSFCNRAIAVFRDSAERFENALAYLKNPPTTEALGSPKYGLKGRVSNKASTVKRLNRDLFDRPKSALATNKEEEYNDRQALGSAEVHPCVEVQPVD